jgi:hypothetical protein
MSTDTDDDDERTYYVDGARRPARETPSSPAALVGAREKCVYTVSLARRSSERPSTLTLDDASDHIERLRQFTNLASAFPFVPSEETVREVRERVVEDVERALAARAAARPNEEKVAVTALVRRGEKESNIVTEVLIEPAPAREEPGEALVGAYVALDAATTTTARKPTMFKYGDWVRERAPFEERLRAWNEAHPDETCVECVMALKRPDPNDPSREETVLTEGLKSNFAVYATKDRCAHCVDARLALPGITLNTLKKYIMYYAASVDPFRGPILSDVERGAFDACILASALRGVHPVDFLILDSGRPDVPRARVDFPASRTFARDMNELIHDPRAAPGRAEPFRDDDAATKSRPEPENVRFIL